MHRKRWSITLPIIKGVGTPTPLMIAKMSQMLKNRTLERFRLPLQLIFAAIAGERLFQQRNSQRLRIERFGLLNFSNAEAHFTFKLIGLPL